MIPMIQQALMFGYTAAQVLKYVGSKFKNIMPGITSAQKQGYSDQDILKFLSNQFKPKNKGKVDQQLSDQEKYMKASGIKTKGEKEETRNKYIAGAVGLGASALGAYNMYQNYGGMFKGMGQTFGAMGTAPQAPTEPQPIQPGPDIGQQMGQNVQAPVAEAMQPTSSTDIAQAAPALQPNVPQPNVPLFQQLTAGVDLASLDPKQQNELKFLSMISDQLEAKGKTVNDPEIRQLGKKIKDVLKGKPDLTTEETARFQQEYPEAAVQARKQVITPDGDIADVIDQPGKTSKVSVGGKESVVETDKLLEVPDNEDEILNLYERLIQAIPEGERSSVLNWVGFDPDRKKLSVRFHSGDAYNYEDIPDEFVKKLEEAGFLAKTTGGNYFGQWAEGEASRGAGLHKLIMELQKLYGGKGKEYSAKMKTVYSYLGPAEKKLKEKLEREREEKRKRKKEGQPRS